MDANGNELPIPARHGQNERAIALTRKNALFAGHDDGAENWAILASLIETALCRARHSRERFLRGGAHEAFRRARSLTRR